MANNFEFYSGLEGTMYTQIMLAGNLILDTKERERERERGREGERDREREREGGRERQRDRERQRETERDRERQVTMKGNIGLLLGMYQKSFLNIAGFLFTKKKQWLLH